MPGRTLRLRRQRRLQQDVFGRALGHHGTRFRPEALGQHRLVVDIDVIDAQPVSRESHLREAVDADGQTLVIRVMPVVDIGGLADRASLRRAWQVDRHTAMADAASGDPGPASICAVIRLVDRQPMLVAPEPENRTLEDRRDLIGLPRVAGIVDRQHLVVGQQYNRLLLDRGGDRLQPSNDLVGKPSVGIPEILDQRRAYGVVAGIEADQAPIPILQAEIAGVLALAFALLAGAADRLAHRRQDPPEISDAARIHLVIAVERERESAAVRPFAGLVGIALARLAQEILADLVRIADEVDVAQMDRDVGVTGGHEFGHLVRLVGARPPIAGERDADLSIVAKRIDAVRRMLALVGGKTVPRPDSIAQIFPEPQQLVRRREAVECLERFCKRLRTGAMLPRSPRQFLLLHPGDLGDAGDALEVAQILRVLRRFRTVSHDGRLPGRRGVARWSGNLTPRIRWGKPRRAAGGRPLGERAQRLGDLGRHQIPSARLCLPEQTKGRIPWRIRPVAQPAPVRCEGKHGPDRLA